MASTNIIVEGNEIYAKIKDGNRTMLSNSSIIIDPLSLSYSNLGTLCEYNLTIDNVIGISTPVILLNGKNSRFSASGTGSCNITLTIEDDAGNIDTDTITITII